MPKYGLMVHYEYCVGCHACELACRQEHRRPEGEWGIRVIKSMGGMDGSKEYYIPFPTDKCNLCRKRTAQGLRPACVHNCWANVIEFGPLEELGKKMQKLTRAVLWRQH
ncbi:4Fe-4S dicluster domain-containing protein [Chloroflexota bacterium]